MSQIVNEISRAGALVGSLISTAAVDVVGVFTEDFAQVFQDARALTAAIKPQAQLMEHPLENGALVVDHRILKPLEAELSVNLRSRNYADIYQQIRQLFINGTKLTLQTRASVYENLILESIPHEETPDQYDSITMLLKLKQVQIVSTVVVFAPRNPTYANTNNRGNQQPTAAGAENTSRGTILLDAYYKVAS